jgi:hypothetical protein
VLVLSAFCTSEGEQRMTQYIVRVRCKVMKVVVCENCTEEQAENEPFSFSVDEQEVEQYDWEVASVTAED